MTRDVSQRFIQHPLSEEQAESLQILRTLGRDLAESIDELCPDSEEKDRALDAVDQAVMWGNASIARHSNA